MNHFPHGVETRVFMDNRDTYFCSPRKRLQGDDVATEKAQIADGLTDVFVRLQVCQLNDCGERIAARTRTTQTHSSENRGLLGGGTHFLQPQICIWLNRASCVQTLDLGHQKSTFLA